MIKGEKSKVTVDIYGKKYTLVGTESPAYILEVGAYVDQKMQELSSRNRHLDATKVAVLTAVNIAEENASLRKQMQSSNKETQQLREEVEELRDLLDDQTGEHSLLKE